MTTIHFLESSKLVQKSPCVFLNSEPIHTTPFILGCLVLYVKGTVKKTTEMASPWLLRGGDGGRKEIENIQSHLEESRAERERRLNVIRAVCKRRENEDSEGEQWEGTVLVKSGDPEQP